MVSDVKFKVQGVGFVAADVKFKVQGVGFVVLGWAFGCKD